MDYINNQKQALKRVIEDLYCVESVKFITLDANTIRRYVDMDYKGEAKKEVLVVKYTPECYACDNYILNWEYMRPDEAANLMEI